MKKAILGLASLALFTLSLSLRADSVLTTVTVGNEPEGIAANPVTNKIYVGVSSLGEVAVINGRTQQISATISVGGNLHFLAVNVLTNRVYATSCSFAASTCSLAVIDGRSNRLITSIPISSNIGIGLQGLALNPITNRIYASDGDNGQYIVIDGKTNTIVTRIPVFNQPAGIAVDLKTDRVYVVGGGFPGEVLVFDGGTNALLATIPEGFGVENVAVDFRLDRAYVTQDVNNALVVVDTDRNQNIAQVATGPFPTEVDVNLLNHKVYVANGNGASVTIIDGSTNQVLQTLSIPEIFPEGVAVNLATGFTYVTDFASDKVVVLQPK